MSTLVTPSAHTAMSMKRAALSARPPRDERIDFWRGLCLFGMVSWHLLTHPSFPRMLAFAVIQPFNFVAEGFVLLAGVSVGLKIVRAPYAPFVLLRRAGAMLLVNYALVSFVMLLAAAERSLGLTVHLVAMPRTVWKISALCLSFFVSDRSMRPRDSITSS